MFLKDYEIKVSKISVQAKVEKKINIIHHANSSDPASNQNVYIITRKIS